MLKLLSDINGYRIHTPEYSSITQLQLAMVVTCRSDLRHIIEKRIGMEHFTDKLSQLPKHESYSHAAKKPQLTCNQPSEVIFDYEFTMLFKRLESKSVVSFSMLSFYRVVLCKHGTCCGAWYMLWPFCLSICLAVQLPGTVEC